MDPEDQTITVDEIETTIQVFGLGDTPPDDTPEHPPVD